MMQRARRREGTGGGLGCCCSSFPTRRQRFLLSSSSSMLLVMAAAAATTLLFSPLSSGVDAIAPPSPLSSSPSPLSPPPSSSSLGRGYRSAWRTSLITSFTQQQQPSSRRRRWWSSLIKRGGGREMDRVLKCRGGSTNSFEEDEMEEEEDDASISSSSSSSTAAAVVEGGGQARNRTAEREQELEWLFNQVVCYQTRVNVASDTLSTCHLGVGSAVFDPEADRPELEVAMSTAEDPLHCRYYFEVEEGAKLVAPCKCRGTQKWVWFSELNRQRRREPVKWKACSTCNAPIDFRRYHQYGSVLAHTVSWPLDHKIASRFIIAGLLSLASLLVLYPLQVLVIRIISSRFFWARYYLWSRVVYGPLPLKLVVVQFCAKYLWSGFLHLEQLVREQLTELESTFLERSLPVTTPQQHTHK